MTADPYELEDLWNNALMGLTGVGSGDAHIPNVQPLVDLLLNRNIPMPMAARETLAELLLPENAFFNWKLVPHKIKTFDPLQKQLRVLGDYDKKIAEGMSREDAAAEAGADEGHIRRYRKSLRELFGRVKKPKRRGGPAKR